MPKNTNLKPIPLPMTLKFGEKATTEFKELESNIKAELIDGPTMEQLLQWVPQFALATWNETANEKKVPLNLSHHLLVLVALLFPLIFICLLNIINNFKRCIVKKLFCILHSVFLCYVCMTFAQPIYTFRRIMCIACNYISDLTF